MTPMTPCVEEAQRRLQQILGLGPELAARAVAEVLDTMQHDVDEYITVRHAELSRQGACNEEIFARIASELPTLRFASKQMTARQIRRRIYG